MSSTKPQNIERIGEFGLIDSIRKNAPSLKHTIFGIGDDAAVIPQEGSDICTIVSTDTLTENIHFDLHYVPLKHLGFKSVAVNVSDIAAMNAIPKQITLSLALSSRFTIEAVNAFYEGVYAACEAYNVDLVGGDTTTSRAGLVIGVTAIGTQHKDKVVYRKGAQENDLICVTGDLGGAYVGLQVLEREKQEFLANPKMTPKLADFEYVVMRQLKPEARVDIIHELAKLEVVPSSMIDISDGLASEVLHLSKESQQGMLLYEEKLPMDKETYQVATTDFNLQPTTSMLNGGEDYELLFTVSQKDFPKIENHPDISVIGFVRGEKDQTQLQTRGGQLVDISAQGWKHF
jgi:thiamine-monophosphate kinase